MKNTIKVLSIVLAILMTFGIFVEIPTVVDLITSPHSVPYKIGYVTGTLIFGIPAYFMFKFGLKKG